jgi:hypothetical protein
MAERPPYGGFKKWPLGVASLVTVTQLKAFKTKVAMEKILPLIIMSTFLAIGCSSPKVNTYETRTYKSVSPENKVKIEQGIIGVGMSIEECKASCPKCQFFRKFASTNGSYELWEVNGGPKKELYLHVVNGRIEKVSESGIQKPQHEKVRQKKNQ